LRRYQDPEFLTTVRNQSHKEVAKWLDGELTALQSHWLLEPFVFAVDKHFFLHERTRRDKAENAVRLHLRKWTRRLISNTGADVLRFNVQMTVEDKAPNTPYVTQTSSWRGRRPLGPNSNTAILRRPPAGEAQGNESDEIDVREMTDEDRFRRDD
jgi:hypothetical protein